MGEFINIFEKFSLSKEVTVKDGEIKMDQQRMMILPINLIALYSLSLSNDKKEAINFYRAMKNGMLKFSMPLGKEFHLSYRDFLDRWIKYSAFGGWGIVEYKMIDDEKNDGFLSIKDMPLHLYLKFKGMKSASDVIFESLIAGALSSTFKSDIDVIEVKCICSGNDACIYYWGSKEYLKEKFPEIMAEKFGD